MANTTVRGAFQIHGTNPQYLVEKVIRARVYESTYWKEHCFALTAASLIDNAVKLEAIGGTWANIRPTEFMCLTLKLLQLQPEKEIIMEYLRAEEFKYLRALAVFYVRLTFDALNVYEVLEPLLEDYRKLRYRNQDGSFTITTMDEFCDRLLTEERVCDIQLPRITQRRVLEQTEGLPARKSKLAKALHILDDEEDNDRGRSRSRSRSGSRSGSDRYMSRSPSLSRSPSPASSVSKGSGDDDEKDRYMSRSPSPSESGASDGDEDRYVSRSPSPGSPRTFSPGIDVDTERIEGDV